MSAGTSSRGALRLLLHVCCAPCATYSIRRLRELGFDLTGFWFNPNIHPSAEHDLRRASAERYSALVGMPLLSHGAYDPERFWSGLDGQTQKGDRCLLCYRLRLHITALRAAEGGFDGFSTTLLISPYQNQAALREIGDEAGRAHGVPFFFDNLRRGWAERGRLARVHGLYLQQYCGCSLSEEEAQAARAGKRVVASI